MDSNITELIRTFGSLASISSGYLNIKKAIVDSNPAKRSMEGGSSGTLTAEEKRSILQMRIQASSESPSDKKALQVVISPEILESATTRMNMARDRCARVIMLGQVSEIDEELAITRTEVCYFLSIILEHNGGGFPVNSNLDRAWKEFRCTGLHPRFGLRSS